MLIKPNKLISTVPTSHKFIKIPAQWHSLTSCKFIKISVQWHSYAKRHYSINVQHRSFSPDHLCASTYSDWNCRDITFPQVSFRTQYHARFDLTLLHDFSLISILYIYIWHRLSYILFFLLRNMKNNLERDVLSLCKNSLFIYIININQGCHLAHFFSEKGWFKICQKVCL